MTQQNLRELAKQGDPTVIASVINRTLQPKGITAQVGRDNDCLQVMIESEEVPNQYALMDFLRKGIMNLGIESIQTVKVYGRQAGEDLPAWEDEIELMPANPMFYADEGEMPKKPVDDDDDFEPQNYNREEEYNPDEHELDDDEHEHEIDDDEHEIDDDDQVDETSSQKKQIPKVAMIGGGVFVLLVAAIAGLYFTRSWPFASSSAPEPPTPSPVPSPMKGASPKPKPTASSPTAKATNTVKATSPSPVAASPSPAKPSPVAASPSPVAPSPVAASPSPVVPSPSPVAASPVAASPSPVAASTSPATAAPAKAPSPKPSPPKPDSWRAAVNKAQTAANLAQTSISRGEWEEVASEWEKAVQLMKAVPPSSPNYQKAQQKAGEYQSNLDIAQRRAAAATQ